MRLKNILIAGIIGGVAIFAPKCHGKGENHVTVGEYKAFLLKFEGVRNEPYRDSRGNLTVGIGHLIVEGREKVKKVYRADEIDQLFREDLARAIEDARRLIPSFDSKSKNVKLILVSLVFNMGRGGASKFKKFLGAINSSEYLLAAKELKNSLWYKQVGRRGLHHFNVLAAENA